MKIDRLMSIVVYLLNNGRTSAQKLAEEFEVSSRTIMRDLESLDQAGIPIQSFYGVEGGYQIMDSFVLEKQVATSHEYDWIITALKGMASAYASKSLEQTLAKVKSLNHTEDIAVSMDLSVASEDDKINKQLMLLEDAIKKKCVVRFSYVNSHNKVKEIQVEPVCIQYKWYNWYLIGYYEKYQDYCMFKLVRMDSLQETDIKNIKIHNRSDIKIRDNNENIVHIKLYGKAIIKAKCREYLNGRITREFENGDFEFCFLNYCVRNIEGTIEQQIDGAFDEMEERLALVGLTLENVVQMNCLFKNIWDIPVMEKVIKKRFNGKYPVRKSFQTEFAHPGDLLFQVDAIAYSTI